MDSVGILVTLKFDDNTLARLGEGANNKQADPKPEQIPSVQLSPWQC